MCLLSVHLKSGTLTACGLPVSHLFCPSAQTWQENLQLVFCRSRHQQTQNLYLYTFRSLRLLCTTQCTRPSLEKSCMMHSRMGLACSRALGLLLCELPPSGATAHCATRCLASLSKSSHRRTVCVQRFYDTSWSQHGVTRSLFVLRHEFRCGSEPSSQWDLTFKGLGKSCALVLCDTCGEWTSGAGLCRRLVDS